MSLKIWIDGELMPSADAKVSVLSHALHYGTGVFEGIRSYPTAKGAAVFRLREHMQRMARGAEAPPDVLVRAFLGRDFNSKAFFDELAK